MPPADETLHAPNTGVQPVRMRGAEGFFRAAQDATGRWLLLAPNGRTFFARAVHGVQNFPPRADEGWAHDTGTLLRAWGFNAVGLGGDGSGPLDGFPFLAAVEFCAEGPVIAAPGVRLPDVLDPEWPKRAAARAQYVCAPLSASVELLGWVTDASVAWGFGAAARRPGLLQICLGLEPGFAAYHAAWEFVLAPHRGRLESLARAWGVPIPNKEVLREMTRAETGLAGRGYWRDDARWARELARRYFSVTAEAIRRVDPHHLLFGCRFSRARAAGQSALTGKQVLAECVYPAVDVAMPDWRELPEDGAMPLLPEVCWAEESFWTAAGARERGLTSVERMLRHARAGLLRLAAHPAVTGFVWSDWEDAPADQPPFGRGLVHADGRVAREHTELLSAFNARAESLRGTPANDFQP